MGLARRIADYAKGIFVDSSSNVGIGTTTPRTQAMILGQGQTTESLADNGNVGGTLTLADNQNAGNAGGALLFAALNDSGTYIPQWAIKSVLTNGTGGGVGNLVISRRASTGATSLTATARFTEGGDFQFNSGYGSAATAYGCRAWIKFDSASSTINASRNVSSITKNGTGNVTINFTTAMPNANYVTVVSAADTATFNRMSGPHPSPSTTSVTVYSSIVSGPSQYDSTFNVAVFL